MTKKKYMNINRKYLRPSEVEAIYGIKQGTLAKQRSQGFGLPYVIIGRKPNKRKGGIILYDVEDLDHACKSKNKVEHLQL
tara:strand:- start:388 stop:627 length:240 start_codon:yes stop_codon:yes gene_type:complete